MSEDSSSATVAQVVDGAADGTSDVPEAAEVERNEPIHFAPGTFCWVELMTADAERAKGFYGSLFGWEFEDLDILESTAYSVPRIHNGEVGGMYEMGDDLREQGVPPHWMSYIAVDNVDEVANRAVELGGSTIREPFDVLDKGRMSVLMDPGGAPVAVWQPKEHFGATTVGELNTFAWQDLATRDVQACTEFYCGLFDWEATSVSFGYGNYITFARDGKRKAGMLEMNRLWAGIPPHWMTYFAVDDLERVIGKAREKEGKLLFPPTRIPDVGRFSIVCDSMGAAFAVCEFEDLEEARKSAIDTIDDD